MISPKTLYPGGTRTRVFWAYFNLGKTFWAHFEQYFIAEVFEANCEKWRIFSQTENTRVFLRVNVDAFFGRKNNYPRKEHSFESGRFESLPLSSGCFGGEKFDGSF
jgi:hypothetical protein